MGKEVQLSKRSTICFRWTFALFEVVEVAFRAGTAAVIMGAPAPDRTETVVPEKDTEVDTEVDIEVGTDHFV